MRYGHASLVSLRAPNRIKQGTGAGKGSANALDGFIALVGMLAWRVGGWRTAIFALAGMVFILVTGLWAPLMRSTYLCGLAVFLCL